MKYFSWSPADSVIAIFSPELNSVNRPAKVRTIAKHKRVAFFVDLIVFLSICR